MNTNRLYRQRSFWSWFAVIPFLGAWCAGAVTPAPEEIAVSRRWYATHFDDNAKEVPFSFVYGGQSSDALLAAWPKTFKSERLDAARLQHTITWSDPNGILQVRCVAVYYPDSPASEWTVYFKNIGQSNTPILENIQGLDTTIQRGVEGEFVLNGIKGDFWSADSYAPYRIELPAKAVEKFAPPGSGKSCDGPRGWPYFNLQMPGKGMIIAVGWPGQWAGTFARDASTGLNIKAGQELTHLYLKPGEEIRTPLIAAMFWEGSDVVRAQNLWRRWYIAHVIPRVNGQPQPPVAIVKVTGGMDSVPKVSKLLEAGIKLDLCWRDAMGGDRWRDPDDTVKGADRAWFPTTGGLYHKTPEQPRAIAWWNTGTWDIDPEQYPDGFKPFTDWAHARGLKFTLWFEPERVGNPNSWLAKNHPEWLLPPTAQTYGVHPQHDPILDEGNPAALDWLINQVDGLIKSQGLDWYREDMNGRGPLPAWRKNDASDRQGMTENLYVQGHLAFWDALRERNPQLTGIDACASGGRRNDLETMRRAVPMCRSDFNKPDEAQAVEGNQGHTYGLSSWLPYQGAGSSCRFRDPYSYRSFYLPSFGMIGGDIEEVRKKAYAECARIAPSMLLGDYYPLTSYSLQRGQWIAWQFDRPELAEGVVQAFRRSESPYETARFKLHGLDAAAKYKVKNFDGGEATHSGAELMEKGLMVTAATAPAALIFAYQLVK